VSGFLALDISEWLTSRPSRFSPGKEPGNHCIEGWVGPITALDNLGEKKIPSALRNSNPRPSSLTSQHALLMKTC